MAEQMPTTTEGPLRMVNTLEGREKFLAALVEVPPSTRRGHVVYLEVGEVAGEPGTFVLSEL